MKQILFLLLALLVNNSSLGQQLLSKDQVHGDLEFLVSSIKKYNPALEVYNPDFSSKSESLIDSVTDSVNLLKYFKLVSRIASSSNEGHFKLGTWEDSVHKGFLEDTYRYMPFSVRVLSGKIYVWSDFSNENNLNRGDEILAINNTSSHEILEKLSENIPSDGQIRTYFEKQAEAGFSWMYYLYIEQPKNFNLRVKRYPTSEILEITTAALNRRDRNKYYMERYQSKSNETGEKSIDDLYTISITETHALLTLKSFDYRLVNTYKAKANKLYESLFKELKVKNIANLVIDLRSNTGGRNEFADDMIPFILKNESGDFLKKSISWEGKEKTYKFPKASKYKFEGAIYCLVNGKTYSAGATLARYLKEYGNAKMIGEETGSRYEGYAAGSSQSVYLPSTDIKIGIPRYHTFYPESTKQLTSNRGVIPDYKVELSIEDLLEGRDTPMDKALDLIKR